jgi:hypothetical protein
MINIFRLQQFRDNTGRLEVFVVGAAVALVISTLVCTCVSLACGGCDPNRGEDDEWDKTRAIDNPAVPWAVRYAPECGVASNSQPSYQMLRQVRLLCITGRKLEFLASGFAWNALKLVVLALAFLTFYVSDVECQKQKEGEGRKMDHKGVES